jgi:putative flippase GtrA
MEVLVGGFVADPVLVSVIGLNLTKAIAAVIVMIWNFVVNRFVTFRDVKWQKNIGKVAVEQQEQFESAL